MLSVVRCGLNLDLRQVIFFFFELLSSHYVKTETKLGK